MVQAQRPTSSRCERQASFSEVSLEADALVVTTQLAWRFDWRDGGTWRWPLADEYLLAMCLFKHSQMINSASYMLRFMAACLNLLYYHIMYVNNTYTTLSFTFFIPLGNRLVSLQVEQWKSLWTMKHSFGAVIILHFEQVTLLRSILLSATIKPEIL